MASSPNSQPISGSLTPLEDTPPLPQAPFTDHGEMAGEPATDRKLELEDGTMLRERIVSIAATAPASPAQGSAPTLTSFAVSSALLDDDGNVATDAGGRLLISSRHEIVLSAEAAGRLGSPEALKAEIDRQREVAAALAQREFEGMKLLDQVLGGRTAPPSGA